VLSSAILFSISTAASSEACSIPTAAAFFLTNASNSRVRTRAALVLLAESLGNGAVADGFLT